MGDSLDDFSGVDDYLNNLTPKVQGSSRNSLKNYKINLPPINPFLGVPHGTISHPGGSGISVSCKPYDEVIEEIQRKDNIRHAKEVLREILDSPDSGEAKEFMDIVLKYLRTQLEKVMDNPDLVLNEEVNSRLDIIEEKLSSIGERLIQLEANVFDQVMTFTPEFKRDLELMKCNLYDITKKTEELTQEEVLAMKHKKKLWG